MLVVFNDGSTVLAVLDDESNELGGGSNVLVVGNFTEESNDAEEELKRLDDVGALRELLDKLDDVNRVDGLLVVVPDNNELVVFTVDAGDKRLEFVRNVLILLGVIFDFDRSEFVVDNREDAVDGFLESAIFLLAQYCIVTKQICKEMEDKKQNMLEYLKKIVCCNLDVAQGKRKTNTEGSTYSCR